MSPLLKNKQTGTSIIDRETLLRDKEEWWKPMGINVEIQILGYELDREYFRIYVNPINRIHFDDDQKKEQYIAMVKMYYIKSGNVEEVVDGHNVQALGTL